MTHELNEIGLHALLSRVDPARFRRAAKRPTHVFAWTGQAWVGTCCGGRGQRYHVRITLVGRRSFNCTCKDKATRGRRVGPCKHVISLAQSALRHLNAA